jgi:hypothetical protein
MSLRQAPAVDFAQIEQQLARAWVDSDRATIDRIIASDWTTIAITGRLLTRAEVMADFFRSGKSPIAAMTIDEVRVRLLGDVAVVTGRTTAWAIGAETMWSCALPMSLRCATGAGRLSHHTAHALLPERH